MNYTQHTINQTQLQHKLNHFFDSWTAGELQTKLFIQNPAIDIPCTFKTSLFNTPGHLNSQTAKPFFSFFLFRRDKTDAVAVAHFIEASNSNFQSPARAPSGGIQCHEQCSREELSFFLSCVLQGLSKQRANQISIKTQASCYDREMHILLNDAYTNAGFKILSKEINMHLLTSEVPFDQVINRFERNKLKSCKSAGFKVYNGDKQSLESIYRFIEESFSGRHYSLSMTQNQFEVLHHQFAEACPIFLVEDDSRIIALCVAILVTDNILYLFLPAYLLSYRKFSPMILLYEAIYDYARAERIQIIDLGTSLDNHGNEKSDLIRFKKNLGGNESIKISYHIQL